MEESRPSLTAFRVATRRAAHQILDRPLVFEDESVMPRTNLRAQSKTESGKWLFWALDSILLPTAIPMRIALRERFGLNMLAKRVASVNEPFRLFFIPDKLSNELRTAGFKCVEDLGLREINARYFANRDDGLGIFSNAGHLAWAGYKPSTPY